MYLIYLKYNNIYTFVDIFTLNFIEYNFHANLQQVKRSWENTQKLNPPLKNKKWKLQKLKILLLFTLCTSSFAYAENSYWYDIVFEVDAKNTENFTSLVNNYYSSIEMSKNVDADLSEIIFKGLNQKGSHILTFSSIVLLNEMPNIGGRFFHYYWITVQLISTILIGGTFCPLRYFLKDFLVAFVSLRCWACKYLQHWWILYSIKR